MSKIIAGLKEALACRYPDCDCEAHEVINNAQRMARRVSCRFVVDREKLARSPMCGKRPAQPEERKP